MMESENQRLKILLSGQEKIVDHKNKKRREFAVSILLRDIDSSSDWLQKQTIQLLYFYKDMPVVNETLETLLLKSSTSESIKSLIVQFFAGELDVSQIIEHKKRQFKMSKKIKEIRAELDAEVMEEKGLQTTSSHLNLVSLKVN